MVHLRLGCALHGVGIDISVMFGRVSHTLDSWARSTGGEPIVGIRRLIDGGSANLL